MKKQHTVSLDTVYTRTYTGILLNENKLCTREDNSLLENKSLLSESKKYI